MDNHEKCCCQLATETRVIRINELITITGLSRTTIWRRVNTGGLPKPICIGNRSIGWLSTEINQWLINLPRK